MKRRIIRPLRTSRRLRAALILPPLAGALTAALFVLASSPATAFGGAVTPQDTGSPSSIASDTTAPSPSDSSTPTGTPSSVPPPPPPSTTPPPPPPPSPSTPPPPNGPPPPKPPP